ncbi:hypothetical protein ES703_60163 [subsurface metagenome]
MRRKRAEEKAEIKRESAKNDEGKMLDQSEANLLDLVEAELLDQSEGKLARKGKSGRSGKANSAFSFTFLVNLYW